MQTVLWVISAALVLIDVFNLGATMERALVDTADHIVAQRQGLDAGDNRRARQGHALR